VKKEVAFLFSCPCTCAAVLVRDGDETMIRVAVIVLMVFLLGIWSVGTSPTADAEQPASRQFVVHPIGCVRKTKGKTEIVLDKQYQPGLLGLDGFSHIYVYWWFDRNDTPEKRATLQIHPSPPGNMAHPLTGVFATRSPFRPNLIGMTLCKIVSVKDNVIEIDGIDAFADTPVLDIKPHVPRFDAAPNATIPWWLKKK
jgi:tRNA-Thr(GGU) m(6)t(6)A37 methyltransferase TsaA